MAAPAVDQRNINSPGSAFSDGVDPGKSVAAQANPADEPVLTPIQPHAKLAQADATSPLTPPGQASGPAALSDAPVVPVAIAQAPAAADPSTAITAAHRTSPEQVVAQVAPAVATLAKAPDGGASVTVQLHPAELGPVQIRIEKAAGGTTEVIVSAAKTGTLDALRSSEAELHRVLDQAGVAPGGRTISFHAATAEAVPAGGIPTHTLTAQNSNARSAGGNATADGSGQGRGGDKPGRGTSGWAGGSRESGQQRSSAPQAAGGRVYLGALDITA